MAKKSERSLLLLCMLFAFACLLLSGGRRLVGGGEEAPVIEMRPAASVHAALSAVPAQRAQTGAVAQRSAAARHAHAAPAPQDQRLNRSVQSDANGNVLLGRTYMRAVYQAFVLDDGFV